MLVQTSFHNKKDLWILDSGCSNNFTWEKDGFIKLERYTGGYVKFGDNTSI